jgi:hypothetical protein
VNEKKILEESKVFSALFDSEIGKKVLAIIYEEAHSRSYDEQKDALSYAFDAGKRSMWSFIAAKSSKAVSKFLSEYLRKTIEGEDYNE